MIRSLFRYLGGPPKEKKRLTDKEVETRIFFTYLVIFLLTFGYNAARYPDVTKTCTDSPTYVYYVDGVKQPDSQAPQVCVIDTSTFGTGFKAFAAGAGWPFYWAWEGASFFIKPVEPK